MKKVLFIDDGGWAMLKQRIHSLTNIDMDTLSENFIKRRVEIRMKNRSITSYQDYSKLLVLDKIEVELLSQSLAIHVTRFFRDSETFEYIKNYVIPVLIKHKIKKNEKKISVWSAGCSSGEEPISILICLLENIHPQDEFDIQVIGTDRDKDVIRRTEENFYEEGQFSETKNYYLNKYFNIKENGYSFKERYAKYLSFEVRDINRCKKNQLDIILCRNTVIYFEANTKNRLYERFYQMLNPGGFFIMGKTEVLIGEARKDFEIFNNKERIFIKPDI